MAIRRRRGAGRMGRRRGRRLMAIIPANNAVGRARAARNAALGLGVVHGAGRAAYNVLRANMRNALRNRSTAARNEAIRERRMQRKAAASQSQRTRGTAELKKSRTKFGRRRRVTSAMIQRLSVPTRILRYGGVNVQDTTGTSLGITGAVTAGKYALARRITTGVGLAGADNVPLYIIHLNRTANTTFDVGPLYSMKITPDGACVFDRVEGIMETGVSNNRWRFEYSSGANASATPNQRYIAPEWYDIRMVLYGAKTQATTFVIEYVQLLDEQFDPLWDVTADTPLDRTWSERNAWYQQQVRTLITNPIATTYNRGTVQGWKVLKRWQYTVAPHLTVESDTSANARVFRAFIRDGRVLSYFAKQAEAPTVVDENIADPNRWRVRDNTNVNLFDVPKSPKARRMIVVRCVNTLNTASGSATDDNTPSFDLIVRKKERLSDL